MKERFANILLLFFTVITYGQVTLAVSEVKNARANQRFNLTILLEISGENMEQETPLRMPDLSKFEIVGSASEQNTVVVDSRKGDVLNQMVYQWVLTPKEAGKIKFGSVLVTVNGKIYKTEPFDIFVRENEKTVSPAENIRSSNDVSLSLILQEKSVYKNEPAIAILKAYSKDYGNFRKISDIKVSGQKNASVRQISSTKSEIETNSGMASQVLGRFIIYPNESGILEINSVSAVIHNSAKPRKIASNKIKLRVKKLPLAPLNFKNAVGTFNLAVSENEKTEISELEKPVNIKVSLSGAGNFGTFPLPQMINSPDYIFFAPKILNKTSANSEGYSGVITADYIVIPKKSGLITVNFDDFSYFDPAGKNYVDLGAKSIVLNVKTQNEIAASKSTIEKVNDYTNIMLETVNTPVLQTHSFKVKEKDKINWNIVFGNLGLMVAVLALFLFVQNKNEERKQLKPVIQTEITTIAETEESIRNKDSFHFQESIDYLKKLLQNRDFERFFSAYSELNLETKNHLKITSESAFKKFLESTKGSSFAHEYNILSEKIQIEKFAPFHDDDYLELILQSINTLYGEIVK